MNRRLSAEIYATAAWSLVVLVFCSVTAGAGLALLVVPRPAVVAPLPVPVPLPAVTVTRTVPARPAPAVTRTVTAAPAVADPAQSGTPPAPHINGATHLVYVDCSQQQCTTVPGAGPYGSTCGTVVDDRQACVY